MKNINDIKDFALDLYLNKEYNLSQVRYILVTEGVSHNLTTKINQPNSFGKTYELLRDYLPPPNENGRIFFEDMTPEQIQIWNETWGNRFGKIVPDTKEMTHYIILNHRK